MTDSLSDRLPKGWIRVATAVVGGPVVLAAAYFGGVWFTLLLFLIAVAGAFEFRGLMASVGAAPFMVSVLAVAAILFARYWVPYWEVLIVATIVLTVTATIVVAGDNVPQRLASTLLVTVYPILLLTFLADIRHGRSIDMGDDDLMRMTILVFFLVWASDTLAYYVGRFIGRTPFFPTISPKKTWEGFAGGFVGTALVAFGAPALGLIDLDLAQSTSLAVICGIGAPLGDLVESRMKRAFNAKDSGTLLPGHGGILDRFDGMLLCAPLVWLYLSLG